MKDGLRRQLLVQLGLLAAALAVLAATARLVVYQGLIRPVRVSSGSMAETFVGEHYELVCDDCGLRFACDRDQPPRAMTAVCPNCGFRHVGLDGGRLRQGERVLIDQLATITPPRRWQVVAFNDPAVPGQLTVKRIVALPGEHVAIRNGEVYLDGRLARKDLARQREVAVLVHDNDHRPRQSAGLPPRWQAERSDSRWQPRKGGFVFAARGDGRPGADGRLDWLTYRHWRCVFTPLPRTEEAPIRDNYGYNQGVARQLHAVTDLMLLCRLTLTGNGRLVVRCNNGREVVQAVVRPAARRLTVLRDGRQVAEAVWPLQFDGRSVEFVFSVFDRQALVAADGEVLVAQPLPAADAPLAPTSRPLAIGTHGVSVNIERLRLYRDLYYLDPRNLGVAWQARRPLGDDELFVLGDNVPISRDSRTFPRPLRQDDVVGGIMRYP